MRRLPSIIQYNLAPAKTLDTIFWDTGYALNQCLIYDHAMFKVATIHRFKTQEFEIRLDVHNSTLIVSTSEFVLLNPVTQESTEFEVLVPIEERSPRSNTGSVPLNL